MLHSIDNCSTWCNATKGDQMNLRNVFIFFCIYNHILFCSVNFWSHNNVFTIIDFPNKRLNARSFIRNPKWETNGLARARQKPHENDWSNKVGRWNGKPNEIRISLVHPCVFRKNLWETIIFNITNWIGA